MMEKKKNEEKTVSEKKLTKLRPAWTWNPQTIPTSVFDKNCKNRITVPVGRTTVALAKSKQGDFTLQVGSQGMALPTGIRGYCEHFCAHDAMKKERTQSESRQITANPASVAAHVFHGSPSQKDPL